MKIQRSSRVINENSNVMGLEISDLLGLAGVYWLLQAFLFPFGLELLAVPLIAIMAILLIRVRLRHRRRVLRDTVRFYSIRAFKNGAFYDGNRK